MFILVVLIFSRYRHDTFTLYFAGSPYCSFLDYWRKENRYFSPGWGSIRIYCQFYLFTLFLSTIVKISGVSSSVLRTISVFVIAGFGISLLVPKFQILIEKNILQIIRFSSPKQYPIRICPGLLIDFHWDCFGRHVLVPFSLRSYLFAITGTVTFDAFVITIAYSLGTAIPMFLIMIGGQNMLQKVPWLLPNTARIQKKRLEY